MQDNKLQSGIYCIENIITGKKYIGQSKNINARWTKHISELNKGNHDNDYLQKAWNKYGAENFKFYILTNCIFEELDEKEKYYIELYKTTDRSKGYNLKSGGQNGGSCYVDETRKKMSISVKKSYMNSNLIEIRRKDALKQWSNPEYKKSRCGENASMYGHHHSDETKRILSEKHKGISSSRRNRIPILCVETNEIYEDATTAGKILSLDSSAILKVCRKERKTCGGYHWIFIENLENNVG